MTISLRSGDIALPWCRDARSAAARIPYQTAELSLDVTDERRRLLLVDVPDGGVPLDKAAKPLAVASSCA